MKKFLIIIGVCSMMALAGWAGQKKQSLDQQVIELTSRVNALEVALAKESAETDEMATVLDKVLQRFDYRLRALEGLKVQ